MNRLSSFPIRGLEFPPRDRETIFEMRFTRKPGGRGLGLYIARQGLDKEGYRLQLAESGPLRGATFRIQPHVGKNEVSPNGTK